METFSQKDLDDFKTSYGDRLDKYTSAIVDTMEAHLQKRQHPIVGCRVCTGLVHRLVVFSQRAELEASRGSGYQEAADAEHAQAVAAEQAAAEQAATEAEHAQAVAAEQAAAEQAATEHVEVEVEDIVK